MLGYKRVLFHIEVLNDLLYKQTDGVVMGWLLFPIENFMELVEWNFVEFYGT